MPAPRKEVFFLYDSTTGLPLTGQAGISFSFYGDDLGNPLLAPLITEIGGGAYCFTITFPGPTTGIVYVVDTGIGAAPDFWARYARPQDWNSDQIDDIREYHEGKWEIKTTGIDANRLIIFAPDGVTVLKKYDLFDSSGGATTVNPYKRVPV